jgi:hypothetical protein
MSTNYFVKREEMMCFPQNNQLESVCLRCNGVFYRFEDDTFVHYELCMACIEALREHDSADWPKS